MRWFVLLLLLVAPAVRAQQPPLSLGLPAALEQGLSQNPKVLAAAARLRAAQWSLEKATSLPSAQVTLGTIAGSTVAGSQTGGNSPSGAGAGFATFSADGRTDRYLQFTQPFLPLGAMSAARAVASQELEMARANEQEVRVQLRQQIKDGFYTVLAAQANLQAVEDNLALARESHQIAEKRFSNGAGPKLDLVDAGIQLSRAEQDLINAQVQLQQSQAVLVPLLGLPPASSLRAEGELAIPDERLDYPKLADELDKNPKVQLARAGLERERASVDWAASQGNPNPMLTFIRDWNTHTYQLQVGLQFPLDWGQIGNEVRAREESVQEQQQNLQALQMGLSSGLRVAVEQYLGAVRNAADFREKILIPSQESTRITQYGFKRGAVPYLRLLTSQQNLTAVRKEYIQLIRSAWLALDAAEAAVGKE